MKEAESKMRDIYISTIIDSHNYGTVLQAVATRDVLSRYGSPLFVDYCRAHWTRRGWINGYLKRDGNSVVNVAKLVANAPVRFKSEKLFRGFVERQLELVPSSPFLDGGSFDSEAIYCVGSDQTWNIECNYGIDSVYFLANVPDGCKKISFSASFGRQELSEQEQNLTAPILRGFDAISVRESSSLAILEDMGVRGGVALKDPVLLCRPELWSELSAGVAQDKSGYVLVYMLNDNSRMCEYALSMAKELEVEARIVTFSPFKKTPMGLKGVCLPTPEEWVALFRDASYIVTDSFHGTCFSLLFEKPMTVFNPPRFSVRLADVLSDFGLADRRVADDEPVEKIDVHQRTVDWERVRASKARFSAEADEFLARALS